MQVKQNRCLRIITGCHQAYSVDHLHSEVEILQVGARLEMLYKQFLVSALRPAHPSHQVVLRSQGPRTNAEGRPMKETLSSKYYDSIQHFLNDDGVMSEVTYKRTLKTIHSDTVKQTISLQGINPLIGRRPPVVSTTEQKLPRPFRVIIHQLRSTQCSLLKCYQLKINTINNDLCPQCKSASQTVLYLFSCLAFPTTFNPMDLWSHPVEVARFLVTLPAFRSLPLQDLLPH
jgi:hypothetical protein